MFGILITIHVLVSIFLIFVILVQSGKGGGLSEEFGGSSTQTILGTRTAAFLTRATIVCAALYLITSLTLAIMSSKKSRSVMERVPMEVVPPAVTETQPVLPESPESVEIPTTTETQIPEQTKPE